MRTSKKTVVLKKAATARKSLGFIDGDLLSRMGACEEGIEVFNEVFPYGTDLTEAACIAAAQNPKADLYYIICRATDDGVEAQEYHKLGQAAVQAYVATVAELSDQLQSDIEEAMPNWDQLRHNNEQWNEVLINAAENADVIESLATAAAQASARIAKYQQDVAAAFAVMAEKRGRALWQCMNAADEAGHFDLERTE